MHIKNFVKSKAGVGGVIYVLIGLMIMLAQRFALEP
jgi:hypothetical protein